MLPVSIAQGVVYADLDGFLTTAAPQALPAPMCLGCCVSRNLAHSLPHRSLKKKHEEITGDVAHIKKLTAQALIMRQWCICKRFPSGQWCQIVRSAES